RRHDSRFTGSMDQVRRLLLRGRAEGLGTGAGPVGKGTAGGRRVLTGEPVVWRAREQRTGKLRRGSAGPESPSPGGAAARGDRSGRAAVAPRYLAHRQRISRRAGGSALRGRNLRADGSAARWRSDGG